MPRATATFEVRELCRVCNHSVGRIGVMPSGHCGVHDCEARGWHYHCNAPSHSLCTREGCYPRKDESA
jgi:hypothetical protein